MRAAVFAECRPTLDGGGAEVEQRRWFAVRRIVGGDIVVDVDLQVCFATARRFA